MPLVAWSLMAAALATWAPTTEVPPEAEQAFARYLTAAARERNLQLYDPEVFLDLADVRDDALRGQARRGGVALRQLHAGDPAVIDLPSGALVHHWVGTTFVAGTTLEQVLDVVRNFEDYPRLFAPEVTAARTLEMRSANEALVYMRFKKTKVVTKVIDTEQVIRLVRPSPDRAYSTAEAVLVREVDNAGRTDERQRGDGDGLLWRLFASWRYLEADGGVWIENESIMLTRRPGFPMRLIVQPMLEAGPREGIEFALRKLEAELRQ